VNRFFSITVLVAAAALTLGSPALLWAEKAAPGADAPNTAKDAAKDDAAKSAEAKNASTPGLLVLAGTAFGVGLVMVGAGYGIGKIGSCAVESMARQPEVANNIQMAMIIAAAMIEGATFFALYVCMSK
jgi:F-type H+-transporting ATPase subunit c